MSFHEIRFPTSISRGAHGGPERRTDVVVLGSGFEERNARWAHSRRSYNAGYGVMGPVAALPVEDYRAQFETNVFSVVRLTRELLP